MLQFSTNNLFNLTRNNLGLDLQNIKIDDMWEVSGYINTILKKNQLIEKDIDQLYLLFKNRLKYAPAENFILAWIPELIKKLEESAFPASEKITEIKQISLYILSDGKKQLPTEAELSSSLQEILNMGDVYTNYSFQNNPNYRTIFFDFLDRFSKEIEIKELNLDNFHSLLCGDDFRQIIDKCPLLNKLILRSSKITSLDLRFLTRINLCTLDLSNCQQITDIGLKNLKTISLLRTLTLMGCNQITDEGLKHLQDLPLETLDISYCKQITGSGFENWNDSLRILYLSSNQIIDDNLKHLQRFVNLNTLGLDFCEKITDVSLTHLKALPLHTLSLSCCQQISEVGFKHLKRFFLPNTKDLSSLHTLNVNGCQQISDVDLQHLENSQLKAVHLNNCNKITDLSLSYLKNCPLRFLDLSFCENITDTGLSHLQLSLSLETLLLISCEKITDAGLKYLEKHPLRELNLTNCKGITNAGLKHLKALPLKNLNLSGCGNDIDMSGLLDLKDLPLETLDLSALQKIADVDLQALVNFKSLKLLFLYNCMQITRQGLDDLKKQCPSLKIKIHDLG